MPVNWKIQTLGVSTMGLLISIYQNENHSIGYDIITHKQAINHEKFLFRHRIPPELHYTLESITDDEYLDEYITIYWAEECYYYGDL